MTTSVLPDAATHWRQQMPEYDATWPVGSLVRVANSAVLEKFAREWRHHHKLQPEQLKHAGQTAHVRSIGYYDGGDVLYWLDGIPGTWHEVLPRRPGVSRRRTRPRRLSLSSIKNGGRPGSFPLTR